MKKKTLLIVEDDADLQQTLKELLEIEGYTVTTASNGKEALSFLKNTQKFPDLILLDLMMPVMDGASFLEAFHKNKNFQKIPIIILSAASTMNKSLKATAIVKKPIELTHLLEVLGRNL